jgi:hypothetical protein
MQVGDGVGFWVFATLLLEGVIKEALRLAPPAGAMMRKTLVDMEVGGGFRVVGLCSMLQKRAGLLGMMRRALVGLRRWALLCRLQHSSRTLPFSPVFWAGMRPPPLAGAMKISRQFVPACSLL